MDCEHCDRFAEWKWSYGNEYAYICQRCMATLGTYAYRPLWQFEPLLIGKIGGSCPDIIYPCPLNTPKLKDNQ